MHKTAIRILLLGGLALSGQAEDFQLKNDETGEVYGPFSSESGAKITIGESVFTIVRETSVAEKRLADTRVRQIRLRKAPLKDAVDILTRQTREIDKEGVGVNFIIAKAPEPEAPPAKDKGEDPFGFKSSNSKTHRGPFITFELRDVSALQVLDSLMDTTGFHYTTTGNVVTIHPK